MTTAAVPSQNDHPRHPGSLLLHPFLLPILRLVVQNNDDDSSHDGARNHPDDEPHEQKSRRIAPETAPV